MSFSFMGYPGNKAKLASQVFAILPEDCSGLVYVEPFFGGGNAYLNLERNFGGYICSDILPHAIEFFGAYYCLEILNDIEAQITEKYDLDVKEDYYAFRSIWNKAVTEGTYPKLRHIGFVLLAHHCINHLVRFGPNGFNQGWGGVRGLMGTRWERYVGARKDNSEFFVRDFVDSPMGKDYFWYLDPPYTETETGIYGQGWTEHSDSILIESIREHVDKGGQFILSSPLVVNDTPGKLVSSLEALGFRNREIQKTYKSSVGKHAAKTHIEGIVSNLL